MTVVVDGGLESGQPLNLTCIVIPVPRLVVKPVLSWRRISGYTDLMNTTTTGDITNNTSGDPMNSTSGYLSGSGSGGNETILPSTEPSISPSPSPPLPPVVVNTSTSSSLQFSILHTSDAGEYECEVTIDVDLNTVNAAVNRSLTHQLQLRSKEL